MGDIHYQETAHGFEYGAANVSRAASHNGHVVLMIQTEDQFVFIRVTPKGKKIVVDNGAMGQIEIGSKKSGKW